jgi:hypothetical protein
MSIASAPHNPRGTTPFSGASRLWLFAALIPVLVTVVLHYRETLLSRVSADNSLLAWYVGVQRVASPAISQEINAKVYPILTEKFDSGLYTYRFRQRQEYFANYPAPTVSFATVAAIIDGYVKSARTSFASFIKLQLVYMWIPAEVIALSLFTIVIGSLRNRLIALAACLSLALLAAMEHLPIRDSNSLHFIWNAYFLNPDRTIRAPEKIFQSVWRDVRAVPAFLLHPGPAFSPFAFEPKTNFTIILLGAVALRWSGSFRGSYGLLAIASLYEQGYGMLLALFLAVIDIIRAPQRILSPVTLTLIGATVIPGLLLGPFWEQIGLHSYIAIAIIASMMLAAVVLILRHYNVLKGLTKIFSTKVTATALRQYARIRAPFLLMSDPLADIGLFTLLWTMSLIAFVPLSLASSFAQSQYYWGNIHGRLFGLQVPVLWMAAFIGVLTLARARIGEARTNFFGVAAAIGLSTLACLFIAKAPDPFRKLDGEIAEYEAALLEPLTKYDRRTESHLYYGISKSIDTERNWLYRLLPELQLSLPLPSAKSAKR